MNVKKEYALLVYQSNVRITRDLQSPPAAAVLNGCLKHACLWMIHPCDKTRHFELFCTLKTTGSIRVLRKNLLLELRIEAVR